MDANGQTSKDYDTYQICYSPTTVIQILTFFHKFNIPNTGLRTSQYHKLMSALVLCLFIKGNCFLKYSLFYRILSGSHSRVKSAKEKRNHKE